MEIQADRSPIVDHVIGAFPRESLSAALASTHRAGFGPQTRVLDGARSDVTLQLARAGLHVIAGDVPLGNAVLIVVTAPGRTRVVADLFEQLGAESVSLASRRSDVTIPAAPQDPIVPDVRISTGTVVSAEG
jgi:hypothetical protein